MSTSTKTRCSMSWKGRLRSAARARDLKVDRGGLVFLPKGIRHGYDILSDGDVRLLVITAPPRDKPGGWGGFLGDLEHR